jgi:hypothetical protein
MPIILNTPVTFVVDKVRIEEFSINAQSNNVTIHYSKGYEDVDGKFVTKESSRVDVKDAAFDPTLYQQVKEALYSLLSNEVNPSS